MAITDSVGYDGDIDETQWAKISAFLGSRWAVAGDPDWKVTVVTGQDRTVRVAAGVGYGDGVMDTNGAGVNITCPVVSSGSRWDAIVARRDWQPAGGLTAFTRVGGTALQSVPALQNTPGTVADQPLALVELVAGQQLPRTVIDLRTFPSKVHTAKSLLALAGQPLGYEAVVDGVRYRQALVGTNVETVAVEPQLAAGSLVCDMPGGSVVARTFTVNLPAGKFRTAPEVLVQLKTSSGNSGVMEVRPLSSTPSTFTFTLYRPSGGAAPADDYPVAWIAVAT